MRGRNVSRPLGGGKWNNIEISRYTLYTGEPIMPAELSTGVEVEERRAAITWEKLLDELPGLCKCT